MKHLFASNFLQMEMCWTRWTFPFSLLLQYIGTVCLGYSVIFRPPHFITCLLTQSVWLTRNLVNNPVKYFHCSLHNRFNSLQHFFLPCLLNLQPLLCHLQFLHNCFQTPGCPCRFSKPKATEVGGTLWHRSISHKAFKCVCWWKCKQHAVAGKSYFSVHCDNCVK